MNAQHPSDHDVVEAVKNHALMLLMIEAPGETLVYNIARYIILLYGKVKNIEQSLQIAEKQLLAAKHNEFIITEGKVCAKNILNRAVAAIPRRS